MLYKLLRSCSTTIWPGSLTPEPMPLTTEHSAPKMPFADSGYLWGMERPFLFMCYILSVFELCYSSQWFFELKEKQQYLTYSYMKGFSTSTQYLDCRRDHLPGTEYCSEGSQSHQSLSLKAAHNKCFCRKEAGAGRTGKDAKAGFGAEVVPPW